MRWRPLLSESAAGLTQQSSIAARQHMLGHHLWQRQQDRMSVMTVWIDWVLHGIPCSRIEDHQQSSWSGRSLPCPWSHGSGDTPWSLQARAQHCAPLLPGCSMPALPPGRQPHQPLPLHWIMGSIVPQQVPACDETALKHWEFGGCNDILEARRAQRAYLAVRVEAIRHQFVAVEL